MSYAPGRTQSSLPIAGSDALTRIRGLLPGRRTAIDITLTPTRQGARPAASGSPRRADLAVLPM
jgi:hypothetical protein